MTRATLGVLVSPVVRIHKEGQQSDYVRSLSPYPEFPRATDPSGDGARMGAPSLRQLPVCSSLSALQRPQTAPRGRFVVARTSSQELVSGPLRQMRVHVGESLKIPTTAPKARPSA